jgi:lipopolysaccharide export system protein LptA
MKQFILILLLTVGRLGAWAQTNAPGERIHIHSDHGSFDAVKYRTIYVGHVRADHPEMKLTSAWLAADLPHNKNPDRHMIATTNVVIDLLGKQGKTTNGAAGLMDDQNQKWHVTGDQAVYDYHLQGSETNETVTISGHAIAQSEKVTATGEPLVYNLVTREFIGTNYDTTFNSNAFNTGGTNTAAGTNQPPSP